MRFIILLFLFPLLSFSQEYAFPTALGEGNTTTGGAGGTVYHVTNLNDTGVGSFRDAVERVGTRTVIFDVGGEVALLSEIKIRPGDDNLTISGETAPSPGISFRNFGIDIDASNIIIRYLTIRLGDYQISNGLPESDCLRIKNFGGGEISNFMLDHLSLSWGTDEIFSIGGVTSGNTATNIRDVSFTNSIVGEPTNVSGYNILYGVNAFDVSFYNNYLTLATERSPLVGYGDNGESSEWINNISYGFESGSVVTFGTNYDAMGNIYKGLLSNPPDWEVIGHGANGQLNTIDDGTFYAVDNFAIDTDVRPLYNSNSTTIKDRTFSRYFTSSTITTWATTIAAIEAQVLTATLGNSLYRDDVDTRLINNYFNDTGSFWAGSDPSTLPGGWPTKTLNTRPASDDSDNDDMLDAAEIALWGDITTTNTPLALTSTTVLDVNGDDINSYDNIRKTHFYLAGDLGAETITLTDADILAFPKADGWGKNTTGGRGKAVYFVTNTNDTGAGSLRQIETDIETANNGGNIIFTTGGIITVNSWLIFSLFNDDISIYGQSAPGDGITIYNEGTNFRSENLIIRHMKFRAGESATYMSMNISGTNQNSAKSGYMLDHLSMTWGKNSGNFGLTANALDLLNTIENLTLSNSLIGESFAGKASILYGQGITKVSYINNAFTNNRERNVISTVGENNEYELINNYFYNYVDPLQATAKNVIDVVGNIWNDGVETQLGQTIQLIDCSTANCPPSGDTNYTGSALYSNDNIYNGGAATLNTEATNALVGSRNNPSTYTPRSSTTVKQYVLDNAGARRNLEGLDALDAHQMNDLNDGTIGGIYTTEAQTIGLPTQLAGTAYTDSDSDGLSDAYETAQGGDVTQSDRPATAVISDGKTVDQSGVTDYATTGYTHLEIFMADLANDWDTFTTVPTPPTTGVTSETGKKSGNAVLIAN
tara:strand:+ start:21206 stop:24019 length:2814 start_codon:yes stop_codon:yes gene_type:complete